MLKKLYIFLIGLITLTGCHDDFDLPKPYGMDEDGTVEFNISVPAMQTLSTRSGVNENEVGSLNILVFDGDENSSVLKAVIKNSDLSFEPVDSDNDCDAAYRVSFKINSRELRENANSLHFYFLANCYNEGLTVGETTLGGLSSFTTNVTVKYGDSDYITMSGHAILNDSKTDLFRNGAKISVTNALASPDEDGSRADLTNAYGFQTYATALVCNILSGINRELLGTPVPATVFTEDESWNSLFKYVNPTNNKDASSPSFVIVKAPFDGNNYFYRLDFKKINNDDEETINVVANHWYQFLIKSVNSKGFDTPEEAASRPSSLLEIDYEIHDHAPDIYNMVSDGVRELGVNHEIIYSGDISKDGDWDDEYPVGVKLHIKLFSKNGDSDYNIGANNLPEGLKIEHDYNWMEIKNLKLVEDDKSYGTADPEGDKDEGKVYEAEIWFKKPDDFGNLEGEINVSWQGLTRKVPVLWERNFDTSKLVKATLKIYDETANQEDYTSTGLKETVDDYFSFLKSENSNYSLKLYGITPSSNNQKVRNEGFHFPVMYGTRGQKHNEKNDSRWSYAYSVDLIDEELKKLAFDWTLEITGDPTITQYVKVNGVNGSVSGSHAENADWNFTLTRLGNALDVDGSKSGLLNDYTYGTGELTLTVTPEKGATQKYKFDLYHTGFFHKNDYQKHRVDVKNPDNAYYYYEVVPIMGASRMRYWLDRNLGAKSAGLYIQATGEVTYYGDDDAAGGYYNAAKYSTSGKPIMYDSDPNQAERLSPPGYRVPMQKVWNALRNSPSFDTAAVGGYFNACYHTSVGDVFFPKARYIDASGTHVGESRAGYYWTSTSASGVEKEETGRWLKVLSISGLTTSYVNGAVYSKGCGYIVNGNNLEDEGYGMSVRCINDIEDSSSPYRTSLIVSGATHVYLYRLEEDGTRVATTTWPGHVIGNASTMSNPNNWFEFAYESDNIPADQFYVIFNYLDDKGIIHTMGNEIEPDDPLSPREIMTYSNSTSTPPAKIVGWKVVDDSSFSKVESGISNSLLGNPSDNNYYWRCYHTSDNYNVYCYNNKPTSNHIDNAKVYRIYWKYSSNQAGLNVYNGSTSYGNAIWKDLNSVAPEGSTSNSNWYFKRYNDEYIYMEIETTDDLKDVTLEFRTDNEGYGSKYKPSFNSITEDNQTVYCTYIDNNSIHPGLPPVQSYPYTYRIYWQYDADSRNAIKFKINNTWYPNQNSAITYNQYIQNPSLFPSGVKYGIYDDNKDYYYLEVQSQESAKGIVEYEVWASNNKKHSGSISIDQMYKETRTYSAFISASNSISGGVPPIISMDPELADGFYRIYWKVLAPDNDDILLKYIHVMESGLINPDGGTYSYGTSYEAKISKANYAYRYFDFKPASVNFDNDDTSLHFVIRPNLDNWNNQVNDFYVKKNWFNPNTRTCVLTFISGEPKYGVSYSSSIPQLAPRRKARSINQAKAGRR